LVLISPFGDDTDLPSPTNELIILIPAGIIVLTNVVMKAEIANPPAIFLVFSISIFLKLLIFSSLHFHSTYKKYFCFKIEKTLVKLWKILRKCNII